MINRLLLLAAVGTGSVKAATPASIYDLTLEQLLNIKVVSIATGTETSLAQAPAVATVISADDIKQMAANTVFEAIHSVTGIYVYPSDFNRMNDNFSIRGIHTAQNASTLLLVNGMNITNEYSGARWNQFNLGLDLIERIEVIRGPGSAVYGADAFSGVINIITKGVNSKAQTTLGLKTGAFDLASSWLSHQGRYEQLKYSINGQWTSVGNDASRVVYTDYADTIGFGEFSNTPGPLDTRLKTYDLEAEFEYKNSYGALWLHKDDGGTGYGAAGALSYDDSDVVQATVAKLGYRWQLSQRWQLDWSWFHQQHDSEVHLVILPAGVSLPSSFDQQGKPTEFDHFIDGVIGEPNIYTTRYGSNMVFTNDGKSEHQWRFEAGFRYSALEPHEFKNFGAGVDNSQQPITAQLTDVTGTPHAFMHNHNRSIYFFSLQDQWLIDSHWSLTAGLRYDHYSDFGSTINPRLALVWQSNEHITQRLLYGEAFRAPSFSELYSENNPVVLGNPQLSPETINTYEYTFEHRPNQNWQWSFAAYRYLSTDLIDYQQQPGLGRVAMNIGSQKGYGFELETQVKPNQSWYLKFGGAWVRAKEGEFGQPVADAPQLTLDLSIDWSFEQDLYLHFDHLWVMDRKRRFDDPRDDIDDYHWSNLSVRYEYSDHLEFKLTWRNLFNTKAYDSANVNIPADLPQYRRGMWLGIAANF